MLFDCGFSGYSSEGGSFLENYKMDTTGISITGPKEWSFYVNDCSGEIVNKGDAITNMVSLGEAFKIISEGIGETSSYTVNLVELSYLMSYEGDIQTKLIGISSWKN